MDLTKLSLEDLQALAVEKRTAYEAIDIATASPDELTTLEALATERDEINAAIKAAKEAANSDGADERRDALAGRTFSDEDVEESAESEEGAEESEEGAEGAAEGAEGAEAANRPGNRGGGKPKAPVKRPGQGPAGGKPRMSDEGDEATEPEGDGELASVTDLVAAMNRGFDGLAEALTQRAPVTTRPRTMSVKDVAASLKRPAPPENRSRSHLSLVAANGVPDFTAGQELDGMDDVADAIHSITRGFAPPSGDGKSVQLQQFPVAKLHMPFADEAVVDDRSTDGDFVRTANHVATEGNIPEAQSLVAAGGWCAPSETLYDLPADESLDGILSMPEMQVRRGGIRFTLGPQFSDFYTNAGFVQTEAQAVAGTTKPCYEVTCPSFTDIRLDAVGLCIKVPILTETGYPELVQRFASGTLVAHQHMKNANVIGRIVTSAGAARVFAGLGAVATDTFEAIEMMAVQRRETYRLAFDRAMEVVLPHWVKAILRADMSRRTGMPANDPITDAIIMAEFAARNLNVQFVYDWQVLTLTDEVWPATFNVLMYPAGTFVKGTSGVINLNAVYDAASLATNVYTGLFMEEGLLVARRQYAADLATIAVTNRVNGRTGPADLGGVTAAA